MPSWPDRPASTRPLSAEFSDQASYAVALAYRIRYSMQMNAREAMHMVELRTTPQGHPAYRRVCQRMHTLIAEEAGHAAVAELMSFVNHSADPGLGRLDAENRVERLRTVQSHPSSDLSAGRDGEDDGGLAQG